MTFNTDWPASRDPNAIGVKPFKVAGRDFPGGVKGGDVATVLTYVAAHVHWRVECLYTGYDRDDWGYNYRPNTNNPSDLSKHARAVAIDINATTHPNGKHNTFTYAQVKTIRKILRECGGVIAWGGDFPTKDEMHFEVDDNATPADVKAVARRLRNPGWWTRPLSVGMSGEDVRFVRRRLGVSDSPHYTPGVGEAVQRLRARLHLPAGTTVSKGMAFYIGAR
jgi:hypothetical protein